MINEYLFSQERLVLESDLAGEYPLYFYWPQDQSILLYSKSITGLLSDVRVPKPLKVSYEGVSFLLQNGVVPPPKTAYKDIYILGIGDKAHISTDNGKIDIQFKHDFPFINVNRLSADEMKPDEDLILQMLAEAVINRIDESKPSFLFHSAGKDSNSIALAIAEAGWQDRITLITHKSKGMADESEISARIAKKMGFKHQVLHEVDMLKAGHKQAISSYFVSSPFPCTDNVSLAYPLYAYQMPELKSANIIDGMGNDVFIGHIPSKAEYKHQKLSRYLKSSRSISKKFPSESLLHIVGRTRSEWTGLAGLSFSDVEKILPNAFDVSDYWKLKDNITQDYLDFRASVRGAIIDQEIFTRKVRNFCDSMDSNMILPWASPEVAKYFSQMPAEYLFDDKLLKNKLILRKMLERRVGLDSDVLGKLGFSYDSRSVIVKNWDFIYQEILQATLWNHKELIKVVHRMRSRLGKTGWSGKAASIWIYRLYLISVWYNNNKYLTCS